MSVKTDNIIRTVQDIKNAFTDYFYFKINSYNYLGYKKGLHLTAKLQLMNHKGRLDMTSGHENTHKYTHK